MQLPKSNGKNLPEKKKAPRFEITVQSCKICKLPHGVRRAIDMAIATGWTQVAVREHWNDLLEDEFGAEYLTKSNVSLHGRKHVSLRQAAVRRAIEKRAEQFASDVEQVADFMLTKEAIVDAVMASGLQDLVGGLMAVEAKDLLAAVQLAKQLEEESGAVSQDELFAQFAAFSDAVRKIVPSSQWELIAEQFKINMRGRETFALARGAEEEEEGKEELAVIEGEFEEVPEAAIPEPKEHDDRPN